MKVLESAENYLESILIIKKQKGRIRAIDIVNFLGFSKPSVSVAMKQLENSGYIRRDEDSYISLTDEGLAIAKSVYERHSILSELFIKLGVPEDIARDDACKIEHYISPETFQCIKAHYKKIL